MSCDKRVDSLDLMVDYLRHVTVVLLAAVGAYWTAIRADEIIPSWIIMLFGGAIFYALFLPYKRAILQRNEWSKAARMKALGALFLGVPMFIVPALAIYFFPSMTQTFPSIQNAILNLEFDMVALHTLGRIILALMLGGILGAMLSNRLYHSLLRMQEYAPDEIEEAVRYSTGRSGIITLGFSLIVVFAVLYLSAGWVHPSLSDSYFLGTTGLIFLLILYGAFSVTYIPPARKSRKHRLLEILLILCILSTIVSTTFVIIGGLFSLPIMLVLHMISKENRASMNMMSYIEQQKSIERKKIMNRNLQEMDENLLSYIYYKLNPRKYNAIAVLAVFWWLYILYFFDFGLGSYLLFLIPGAIGALAPYIWLTWINVTGRMDEVQREIDRRVADGEFRFWKDDSSSN